MSEIGPHERKLAKVHCCDFCGKRAEFVELMITGAGVDICNECVDVCVEVIAERRASKAGNLTSKITEENRHEEIKT